MSLTKIGRYQILGELGRGAMGVVYRALDPNIGRELAIKTIHLDLQEGEAVERFRREAKAAGNLSHPNIVTIYDAGEDEGVFYIAMELLSGETLQEKLKKGSMTVGDMVAIVAQIAAALDYAHGRNVVHRDIKPGNIMIADGHVKVMDFGLAKITSTMATATNRVVGTPSYMSPEQITSGTIDGRSDQFSLGAILYEMLAGVRPFRGDNIAVVMFKIMKESPEPLLKVNPSLPPGLHEIVSKALSKEPGRRYATCGELMEELRACLGIEAAETGVASTAGVTPARARAAGKSAEILARTIAVGAGRGSTSQKEKLSLREHWKAVTLAGAGVLVLLLATLAFWQNAPPRGPDAEAPGQAVDVTGEAVTPSPPAQAPTSVNGGATALPAAPQGRAAQSSGQPGEGPSRTQAQQMPPGTPSRPAASAPQANPAAAAGASSAETAAGGVVGRVVVHTEPQGARIFVNDQETSYRTPVNFALAPGTYQIRVERPGYDNQTKEIVVRENQSVSAQFELQRNGDGRSPLPFR